MAKFWLCLLESFALFKNLFNNLHIVRLNVLLLLFPYQFIQMYCFNFVFVKVDFKFLCFYINFSVFLENFDLFGFCVFQYFIVMSVSEVIIAYYICSMSFFSTILLFADSVDAINSIGNSKRYLSIVTTFNFNLNNFFLFLSLVLLLLK